MQQDYLQTDLTDKTETATRLLEEALSDFRKGMLQEAAEKDLSLREEENGEQSG